MSEPAGRGSRTLNRSVTAVAVASLATIAVLNSAGLGLPIRAPLLATGMETLTAGVALLLAYLAFGRARVTGLARDLALVYGLALLATTNLAFKALPLMLDLNGTAVPTPSAAVALAAACFVVAAFGGDREASPSRRAWADLAVVCSATGVVVAATSVLLGGSPPADPTGLVFELAAAITFGLAAVGFTRRAATDSEPLLPWLAVGSAFVAVARLDAAFMPEASLTWIGSGDLLRYTFYVSLLIGAALEIRAYWADSARVAVLEERRRIARDLHDGLAQELAYIATETGSFATADDPDGRLAALGASAQRALGEARRAIAALTASDDQSLEDAIAQAAEEIAHRSGINVALDLEPGIRLGGRTREDLLRILREAVTNAARHAHADVVEIRLRNHAGVTLQVHDDGQGFDAGDDEANRVGYGLRSMRERAERLGGDLKVWSLRGVGTEVEVRIP